MNDLFLMNKEIYVPWILLFSLDLRETNDLELGIESTHNWHNYTAASVSLLRNQRQWVNFLFPSIQSLIWLSCYRSLHLGPFTKPCPYLFEDECVRWACLVATLGSKVLVCSLTRRWLVHTKESRGMFGLLQIQTNCGKVMDEYHACIR